MRRDRDGSVFGSEDADEEEPPHIYEVAGRAYHRMREGRCQAVSTRPTHTQTEDATLLHKSTTHARCMHKRDTHPARVAVRSQTATLSTSAGLLPRGLSAVHTRVFSRARARVSRARARVFSRARACSPVRARASPMNASPLHV